MTVALSTSTAARDLAPAQLALIRQTIAKDCNDSEFDLFIQTARHAGLDPFRRQIYGLVMNKENPTKRQLVLITGIDGFRAIALRSGDYRPDDLSPRFVIDPAMKSDINPLGLVSCEVSPYKRAPDGTWHKVAAIAYWDEFAPVEDEWAWNEAERKRTPTGKKKLKDNWGKMPRIMLSKVAEAQALRRGWPESLSGLYSDEELDRSVTTESASAALEAFEKERRHQLVNAKDCVPMIFAVTEGIVMVPVGTVADRIAAEILTHDNADWIDRWREMNRAGLQQFWAMAKGDALEIKKRIEGRILELRRAGQIIVSAG